MNVNLLGADPTAAVADIDNHLISVATAKFPVTGKHLLLPEGRNYPGSYQVWLQIHTTEQDLRWIYVNPEGVVVHREFPGMPVRFPE